MKIISARYLSHLKRPELGQSLQRIPSNNTPQKERSATARGSLITDLIWRRPQHRIHTKKRRLPAAIPAPLCHRTIPKMNNANLAAVSRQLLMICTGLDEGLTRFSSMLILQSLREHFCKNQLGTAVWIDGRGEN